MTRVEHRLSLDIRKECRNNALRVKRDDTARRLRILLVNGIAPYMIAPDCYAVFSAIKPDGNRIFNPCTIEDNRIIYDLTPQTTAVEGMVECEIRLYGADDLLITSPGFELIVDEVLYDEEKIPQSETEVTALTGLISDATEVIAEGRELIGDFGSALGQIEGVRDEAEEAAQAAAKSAESARAAAGEAAEQTRAAQAAAKAAVEANKGLEQKAAEVEEARQGADDAAEAAETAENRAEQALAEAISCAQAAAASANEAKQAAQSIDKEQIEDHEQRISALEENGVPTGGGFVAQPEPPEDTSLLWIDTDDESGEDEETAPGGYYTPTVSQPDANTMEVAYTPSSGDMPAVEPVQVALPAGPVGATGSVGPQGPAGTTPHIGDNGNWWIGETDTGVSAGGGGGETWELIADIEITEPASSILIDEIDGQPFELKRLFIDAHSVLDASSSNYGGYSLSILCANTMGGKDYFNVGFYGASVKAEGVNTTWRVEVIGDGVFDVVTSENNANVKSPSASHVTDAWNRHPVANILGVNLTTNNPSGVFWGSGSHIKIFGVRA